MQTQAFLPAAAQSSETVGIELSLKHLPQARREPVKLFLGKRLVPLFIACINTASLQSLNGQTFYLLPARRILYKLALAKS